MPLNETAEDKMNRLMSDPSARDKHYNSRLYEGKSPEQKNADKLKLLGRTLIADPGTDEIVDSFKDANNGAVTEDEPINNGDFMSEFEVTLKEAEQYDDPEWAYENLIILGHMSVIVAEPNAGKTTIFMNEVCPKLVKAGYEVIYVNADVGQADSKSMVKHALDNCYRLLLPDMKEGLSMNRFVEQLQHANDNGKKFPKHVFIFDTLKKMTDVINKHHAKELFNLLRSMTAKGATIVTLGHTNKYKDLDGKPIYEGTGDLRSDFDELIYLIPEKHSDGSITVSTQPDKVRGKFEPITFEIDSDRNVSLADSYIDVSAKVQENNQNEKDSPTIELITEAINAGQFTEAKILEHCKLHHTGWRIVRGVLERNAGKLWYLEKAFKNNAKQYFLIKTTPP